MSIHLLNSLQNQYSTKFYVFNKYILRYNKLIFINYITLISYKCQLISNSQSILHGLYLYLYLQKNNLQKVGIIMKKEERRDLSMSVWREQPIRKKILIITAFAVIMLTIFKVDDWQQKRYALVRDGYQQMSQGEYQKAEEEFSQYLDGVSFPLYWKLQYLVNRDETSYENVRNALTECQKHLRNKKTELSRYLQPRRELI